VPGLTDRPAVVSPEVIDGLLRHELGFDGLVVTDSLSAEAITGAGLTLPQAAAASVAAGADLVLFGSTLNAEELALLRPEAVATTLHQIVDALVSSVHDGSLSEDRLDEAVAHVIEVKGIDLCGAPG
jgi:beta-N-acetylhexosaminidase